MLFVICTVFGVMLLVCQTTLSVLGIGESHDLWNEESDPNEKTNSEATPENDPLPMAAVVDQPSLNGHGTKAAMASVRALGTAITFFGLMGSAAEANQFSRLPTFGIAFVVALLAFAGVSVLFRLSAFQPYRTETKNLLDDLPEQDTDQKNHEFSNEEIRA